MESIEICQCCGHKTTIYKHTLNASMVSALAKLVEFYEKNKARANLQKDLALTKNQYNNFQKLQYWGLVHRNNLGWLPTWKAMDFIHFGVSVVSRVATKESEPLPFDHPVWQGKIPPMKFASEFFPEKYNQREEYQEEKGFAPSLFD